ncbi:MAG: hypothetical protein ABFR33_04085 [Verrucomicrobiota bacterium]
MRKRRLLPGIMAVLAAVAAQAVSYLDEDFDALTAATYYANALPPAGPSLVGGEVWASDASANVQYSITDGTSCFGAGAGQALRLYDSTTSGDFYLVYEKDAVSGAGVFEFDYYLETHAGWVDPWLDIKLYDSAGLTDSIFIRLQGTTLRYYDGSWQDHAGAIAYDTHQTLRVEFDTAGSGSATVKLDGAILGTYDFRNAGDVQEVRLYDGAANQTDVYIDNLQLFKTSLPGSPLPFHETFETNAPMAGALGTLHGQHGWSDPSSNALVQSSESWEFDQAVSIGSTEILQGVGEAGDTNVQLVFAWNPVAGNLDATEIPPDATVVFWANADGGLSAYSNQVPIEISGVSAQTGQWSRILVQSDYVAKEWSLWLDGTQVIDRFGFYDSSLSHLTEIAFRSDNHLVSAYVDDVLVDTNLWAPQPGDTDGDGLDDDWEMLYFRSPHTLSSGAGDYDSDGMSDGEEEIAYTDPTDGNSAFGIVDGTLLGTAEYVIYWPSAAGRVYAVDSSTNLVDGIWSNIESNIAATPPENTYTVLVDSVEAKFIRVEASKE